MITYLEFLKLPVNNSEQEDQPIKISVVDPVHIELKMTIGWTISYFLYVKTEIMDELFPVSEEEYLRLSNAIITAQHVRETEVHVGDGNAIP